ncbi:MAG: ribonuclease HI family protein [bacterium]
MDKYILHTDGGSRGNPGPAAAGWVISQLTIKSDELIISKNCKYLGIQTNNYAEYSAVIEGMKECLGNGFFNLEVKMDSELAIKQIKGIYKVKNPQIASFMKEIVELKKKFETISFTHVYREYNKEADRMVNLCLDERKR